MTPKFQEIIAVWLSHCQPIVPEIVCRHADLIVYLAPSIPLAILIHFLSRRHSIFFLFHLAGTICHELAHFFVAFMTGARPVALSIIPRRLGDGWVLGSVAFTNARWYNAAPVALAPFLVLLVPLSVAYWRTRNGLQFEIIDLMLAVGIAPQFLSFWPSSADWKIAVRSWPVLVMGGIAWWWWL